MSSRDEALTGTTQQRRDDTTSMIGSTEPLEFDFSGVDQYFLTTDNVPFVAVKDIDLAVTRGEFVSIIGPSGCGKSTLLNMASGLLTPTRGSVRYRGQVIDGINTEVGYLTQQDRLLPWRTVEKNVGLALEVQGVRGRERRERVADVLERVGLTGFGRAYPSQLSGGMRKRAALAQVLVYEPGTLLMDEPFGALDAQLRLVMQRELLELWRRARMTVLFVTHDLEEAILLADKIVVFGASPGHIVHTEPVELPRPRSLEHLRSSREFGAIWERLWALLERELSSSGHADEVGK